MKKIIPWLLPIAGALLLAFSQPVVLHGREWNPQRGWALLCLVALVPFLRALKLGPGRFWFGFAWGAVFHAATLFWIAYALTHYGHLPLAAGIAILALVIVLMSLFTALFAWLLPQLNAGAGSLFWAPLLWTALEYARNYCFTGFCWNSVPYGLARIPFLIQPLDLAGLYGMAFLVLLVNSWLAELWSNGRSQFRGRRGWESGAALLLICLAWPAYSAYQWRQQAEIEKQAPAQRIGLVQGNIPQDIKSDFFFFQDILSTYQDETRRLLPAQPALVVWPEASLPRSIPAAAKQIPWFSAPPIGVPVLFGEITYEEEGEKRLLYNSALLADGQGAVRGLFHKTHLVPMSEYVPPWFLLPVHKMAPLAGNFTPGQEVHPLSLDGLRIGPLICYESVFPEIARQHARQGAQLLAVITNDAWFGHSSGPYQHFYIATFRAVENRLPLVRAANTGISAFIDRRGRIEKRFPFLTRAAATSEMSLVASPRPTLYQRCGDLFAWLAAALCLARLLWQRRAGHKGAGKSEQGESFSVPDNGYGVPGTEKG